MPIVCGEVVKNGWSLTTDMAARSKKAIRPTKWVRCIQGRGTCEKCSASCRFTGNRYQSMRGGFLWISEQPNIRSATTSSRIFTERLYLCAPHLGANHQRRIHLRERRACCFCEFTPRLHRHCSADTNNCNARKALVNAATTAIAQCRAMSALAVSAWVTAPLPHRDTS